MLLDCNFAGTFRQDFDVSVGIGDLMEVSDDEQAPEHQQPAKKKNSGGLPDIDGEDTLADYIAKFKRACLGKRQQQRDIQKKLDDDGATGYELLACISMYIKYIYIYTYTYTYV